MIEDSQTTHEWYLQCDDGKHLLYKAYGRTNIAPSIPVADFLTTMRKIVGVGDQYSRLEQSLAGRETVPLVTG